MSDGERWLSVRSPGWLADEVGPVRESQPPSTQNRRRLFLLVHGYNNTEADARESFGRFLDNLRGMGSDGPAVAGDVGYVFWPGNTNLGLLISALSYPLQVPRAIQSGMNLGNYLAQLEGPAGAPTALYLIGHSLGCRVVLEILRAMSGTPRYGVFVAGCSLMAAAVPEEVARTAWPLLQGIGQPRRACVLFSTHDLVLHYAFPVGETAAGEDVLPTAVGRYGEPHDLWDWRRDCAPDGHGAYWADGRAATEAVRLVNGAVPAGAEARQTARRSLPQTTVVASRGLQERRLAPERELQTA